MEFKLEEAGAFFLDSDVSNEDSNLVKESANDGEYIDDAEDAIADEGK